MAEDTKDKRSSDPTKDPKFQAVVQHFLETPHKPHKQKREAVEPPRASTVSGRGRTKSQRAQKDTTRD